MDGGHDFWHFPAMNRPLSPIPAWQLYGEETPFPDLLHIERIIDRAKGLDWRIDPHRHVQLHQIFLLLSGQIATTVEGTAWQVTTPCLLNIPRLTTHSFAFSAGTEGFVLTLATADFPELFASGQPAARALSLAFPAKAPAGVAEVFARLHQTHAMPHAFRALRLRALALSLALSVAETVPTPAEGTDDPRLMQFDALIRQHLADHWQLADYARALALSERHLRRLCLTLTGQSAHALIEATRLREACRLLAYTRMQVQEVGFATGFDDPAYFGRAFQRRMGLSPGAYRARLEG
jgi:AraC family transcriptional activator of pobA